MELTNRKILVVYVLGILAALWFSSKPLYVSAQEIYPTPAAVRSEAAEADKIAKGLRKSIKYIATTVSLPILKKNMITRETLRETSTEITKAIRRLGKHIPAETLAALRATDAAMKALRHQAHAFDALAKKLRQEADRLEREQMKKN